MKRLEHGLGPVEDLAFAHPGALAHLIHGPKTSADKSQDLQRFKTDLHLIPPLEFQGVDTTDIDQNETSRVRCPVSRNQLSTSAGAMGIMNRAIKYRT